jgi:hypothetical protein
MNETNDDFDVPLGTHRFPALLVNPCMAWCLVS